MVKNLTFLIFDSLYLLFVYFAVLAMLASPLVIGSGLAAVIWTVLK